MTDALFTYSRTLDYPRATVYKAWTDPVQLATWFGPKGFKMLKSDLDLRPNGHFHYGMEAPNGASMFGKWVFREIVPLTKLVFVSSFTDADGNIIRHPMSATWPLETLSTIIFEDDKDGTRISMEGTPINATAEEMATFAGAAAGMNQGWNGTFEQLLAFLAG